MQDTPRIRAGAAAVDVTPNLGCNLAGSMSNRVADHVHDPLHVKALVLDDGTQKVVLATVDVVALPKAYIDEAKHMIHGYTGIPIANMLVAATHTHSAPATRSIFQSTHDEAYMQWMTARIADAARIAVHRLAPVRIGWAVGHEPSVIFNRRYYMREGTIPEDPFGRRTDRVRMNPGVENPDVLEPAGPTDPDVNLLVVETPDGVPLAAFANYSLHYVGGNPGNDISADYFAMWGQALARLAGVECGMRDPLPPFLGILSNGCSGDINNIDVRRASQQPYPYHQMRRVAEIVAAEAWKTWQKIEWHDHVSLDARVEVLELGVRLPTAAEVDRARQILAQAGPELRGLPEIYAAETIGLAEWEPTFRTPIQAIRIGDMAIATFPGEAFVEIGLETKANSPFSLTFTVELANDYSGYIPTPEHHRLGGYETWRARSSFLEEEASVRMVETALRLLDELHVARGNAPSQ